MYPSMSTFGKSPRRKSSNPYTAPYPLYVPADIPQTPSWPAFQQELPTMPKGGLTSGYEGWGNAHTYARPWDQAFQGTSLAVHQTPPQSPMPSSLLLEIPPKAQGCHPLLATRDIHGGASQIIFDARFMEAYDHEYRRLFDSSMVIPAFGSAARKVRLICKDLPWSIEVRNDKGITVRDVLFAIFTELQHPLSESEYWLPAEDDRDRMIKAYAESQEPKVGRPPRNKNEGVKRVDYLGTKTEFAGIRPAAGNPKDKAFAETRLASAEKNLDGVWILKFREAQDD